MNAIVNAVWVGDFEIAASVGDWWTDDMDLSGGYDFELSKQAILELANKELAERGCTMRVTAVRDATDYLEWQIA
jgi:hypothetical protein